MEFFEKSQAVKLKTHLDRYLIADDDKLTVRQSSHRAAETRRARWLIEHVVESNRHVIRLKSCYGRYLTASNAPFLLGFTGKKVVQSSPENEKDNPAIEWQPVRDGFQVMLRSASAGGTYLRANGNVPPWRNTVTHDGGGGGGGSTAAAARSWILWEVEAVEVPEDEEFSDYLELISSYSAVSDEISGLEFGSPASIHSSSFSPRTPMLSMTMKKRGSFQVTTISSSVMDLFHNAKAVRLKSHHNKYLHADDDEESVSQDRNGAAKNNRWTVEFITDPQDDNLKFIRLKSCYNRYLTASNHPFLLGMTGRKVLQTLPRRLDSSVEWEPVREGGQVKLRTRYGQYLRANGGLPPWRNSITHDVPHRTATQEWVLWDVDVVDIVVQSPAPGPPPALVVGSDYYSSESSSPAANRSESHSFERQESTDSYHSSPPKMEEGRAIYYTVLSDDFGEIDENAQGFCINFKGNNINELTRKLEQETGMKGITVCQRNPINRELYPLRLQLPPNNVTMKVIVVQNSSSEDSTDDI